MKEKKKKDLVVRLGVGIGAVGRRLAARLRRDGGGGGGAGGGGGGGVVVVGAGVGRHRFDAALLQLRQVVLELGQRVAVQAQLADDVLRVVGDDAVRHPHLVFQNPRTQLHFQFALARSRSTA